MNLPDWLANIFQNLGLLSSEKEMIEKEIAKLEEERRELRCNISENIKELGKKKTEYQALFPKFQAAQEPEKGLLAIELRSLKSMIEDGTSELSILISSKVKVLDSLIQTEKMKLFALEHNIPVEKIEEATFAKEEINEQLAEEVEALKDLQNTRIGNEETTEKTYGDLEVNNVKNNYDDLTGPTTAATEKTSNLNA